MNILHIDRSVFFQKIIKNGLVDPESNITGCSTVAEALQLLAGNSFDLILTAQELNDGTAEDFLIAYSEAGFEDVPVIMLSSTDSIKVREKYFNLGVIDFISKNDFSDTKLNEHLDNLLSQDKVTSCLRNASIAIVDDSRFSLTVLKNILNLHRISNFRTFTDPDELVGSDTAYDVYLIDMVLPNISGRQLIMKLRKQFPMAVIIAISSLDNYKNILHALEAGADDYIIKTYDARLMIARLKTNFRNYCVMKELENRREQMEEMAVTDELTGAKNRRYLLEQLDRAVKNSDRYGYPLSILLIDIDFFKRVNDVYGHSGGDKVLKKLVSIIMSNCREVDIFGRYGGEEFILIMPYTDISQAAVTAEKIRKMFEAIIFHEVSASLKVTFSGGLCQWESGTGEQLIKKADELLYAAKDSGRNNIKF